MTVIRVAVILICLSHCKFSKAESDIESSKNRDDIVECVFAIKMNSTIQISKRRNGCTPKIFHIQVIQNIGKIEVRVTSLFGSVIVERSKTKIFLSPVTISNFNTSYKYSAIVYALDSNKNNEYYIQDPEEGYDQNKIFWKAFGLGVSDIEWDKGSSKMISSFWHDGKNNVWQKIYEVIKDLLDENTRQRISNILTEDIESINQDLHALYDNYTKKSMEIIEFQAKYVELIDKLKESENIFILRDNEINTYIIPLYSNIVRMKMSLFTSGVAVFQGKLYSQIRRRVVYQYRNYNEYIRRIAKNVFDELFDTVYAGGLYNVINGIRYIFNLRKRKSQEVDTIFRLSHTATVERLQIYFDRLSTLNNHL